MEQHNKYWFWTWKEEKIVPEKNMLVYEEQVHSKVKLLRRKKKNHHQFVNDQSETAADDHRTYSKTRRRWDLRINKNAEKTIK